MNDNFEALLDAHLERLHGGQPVDKIPDASVDDAAYLAALVDTAAMIRDLPRPSLSPRAARLIESRLVDRAAAMRSEARDRRPRARGPVALPRVLCHHTRPFHRTIGLAASILMVLAVVGVGSVVASGDSLPASPLYGLKIAGERAQLMMSQSATGRARTRLLMAEHRLTELDATVAGQLEPDELVDGLQQEIGNALTEIESLTPNNAVGLLSQLQAITTRQQAILQSALLVAPTASKDDLAQAATAADQAQMHVTEALARALRDQPATDNAKSPQGPTTSPSPRHTNTAIPAGASPRASSTPAPRTASPTTRSSNAASFSFTSRLDAIDGSYWKLGDRRILVDGRTETKGGPAQVGATIHVEVTVLADGTLFANEVELKTASEESGDDHPRSPTAAATATPAARSEGDKHDDDNEDEQRSATKTQAQTATPVRLATNTAAANREQTNTPKPSPTAGRTSTPRPASTAARTSTPAPTRTAEREGARTPTPNRDD